MRFNATGSLNFNALDSKLPWKREGKTKNGDKYMSVNIAIAPTKANRMMSECFGMMSDEIKTMDTDNNKISIDWSDRNDPEVISKVANYRKHVIAIGDERKEFISDYDFVKYIEENIDELKSGKFTVTGTSSLNEYNGKLSHRFQIQNIYQVDDDTKNQLKVTMDFYWTADGVDFSDWKDEKKIRISGYTTAYVASAKKNMYVAQDVVFDAGKIDFENEKHVALLTYKLKQMGIGLEDGKPTNKLKKNKIYKLQIICSYFNGAQEVEIDESMLNENQRMAISLGLKELKDFAEGNVYGDRIVEYRVIDFNLKGDYEDGCISLDEKVSEFEEDIYTPAAPETEEEVLDKAIEKKNKSKDFMNKPETDDEEDDDNSDLDDLFD